ncbi:hypothetical protein KIW84_024853, partial [Lathyrus oleraceus]
MTFNLCVLTPNRIVWDSEVKEIILSTNSGQIGVLQNHAPIATALDIGILRIRLKDRWLTMTLMGGFARGRLSPFQTDFCFEIVSLPILTGIVNYFPDQSANCSSVLGI